MARKTNRQKLLLGVTAVMLAAAPFGSYASAATASAATPAVTAIAKVVKPVFLNAKSYINLVDATVTPVESGQIVAFTLSIYNGSSSELDLSDYLIGLANKAGTSYSLKSTDSNNLTLKLSPGTKKIITAYATIGQSTKLSDLVLKVSKFDFSLANYVKTIGSFNVPANYTNVVGSGSYKVLYFNGATVNTKVYRASIGTSGDTNYVTVDYVYNNTGKNAITLSKYKYYLMSKEGIMYEATSSEDDALVIDPLERKEFQLTASVPASLGTSGWKLVVMNASDDSVALPVGAFQIAFNGGTTSTSSDNFTYANAEGKYQFNLTQLLREPLDSQDTLAARIRITNKTDTSVDMPNVSGYFYLDDKVKLDFKTIATSNQFGLNANGYVDVDVYAKIPANYNFSKATLVINNQADGDTTATKIGELSGTSTQTSLPLYAVDKPYTITREGSQMSGVLNDVNVYKTTTSKLYTAQMTLTSNEKRSIDPVSLTAYLKSENGDIFPATVSAGTGKVNPQNKALVVFKASVPLNYDTGNLRLIVGEAVTDNAYTSGTAAANAYVNGVTFNLPAESNTLGEYTNVPLLPYLFTIHTFTPTLLGDNVKVTFDYDLIKDSTYNVYPDDRSLVMDIVGTDVNTGTEYTYFSQELKLEGTDANSLEAGTDNEIVLEKANPYNGVDGSLKFKVRLYEIVDGAKKLVVEKPLDYWFLDNEWNVNS